MRSGKRVLRMLYGAKRAARKLLSSWPGRLLTFTLAIFVLFSIFSTFIELKDNAVRLKMTTLASIDSGHRWRLKTEKPKLLADIIPAPDNEQLELKEQKKYKEVEARMLQRQVNLKEGCKKHGLDVPGKDPLHQANPWEYFINRERKFVWCNVFKSASTSWMYVFNILAGYSEQFLKKTNRIPLTLARDRYPRPSTELLQSFLQLENVTSLLIGR